MCMAGMYGISLCYVSWVSVKNSQKTASQDPELREQREHYQMLAPLQFDSGLLPSGVHVSSRGWKIPEVNGGLVRGHHRSMENFPARHV